MKEMIKRVRGDKGGFTLAELLVVVAIIMVLVAVAIPVFIGAQNKAEIAVEAANLRSVKAEATTSFLLDGEVAATGTYFVTAEHDVVKGDTPGDAAYVYKVEISGTGSDAKVVVAQIKPVHTP